MNLQQLRYFVAVADDGTMTGAAARLHVSQPALSRAVRDLEEELQLRLFERIGRNVVLSPHAVPVLEAARRTLAAIDDVTRAAECAADGPLVLCTTSSIAALFAERLMPAVVGRVHGRHIRLVHADGPDEIEDVVLRGGAELGIVDLAPCSALASVKLCEEEVVLVSPPAMELPDPLSIAALDGLRLVLPTTGSPRRRQCDEFFAAAEVTPTVVLETDDRSTWTSAVLNSVGSVLWYATNAYDATRRGARVHRFEPAMIRSLYVVHRPEDLSPGAVAFLEAVEASVPA
jgi:DNA-binding transcriptional LysR family regulator